MHANPNRPHGIQFIGLMIVLLTAASLALFRLVKTLQLKVDFKARDILQSVSPCKYSKEDAVL